MTWLITLIIGAAAGFALAYFLQSSSSKVTELEEQLESKTQELNQYKNKVSKHFESTAGIFNNLTQEYKKLYEHMAESSHELCPGADTLLPQQAPSFAALPEGENVTNTTSPTDSEIEAEDASFENSTASADIIDLDEKRDNSVIEPPKDYVEVADEDDVDKNKGNETA